ncbi:MAG: NPCBM/NEW2 domain-containing protein [Gemmataceae bacterium]
MPGWSILVAALIVGQPAEVPRFDVRAVSGAVGNQPVASIGEGFAVRIQGGKTLGEKELVSLQSTGAATPAAPLVRSVVLTSGDQVKLDADGMLQFEEETLRFELPKSLAKAAPISIRATAVSVLWFAPPDQADRPAELRHRVEHSNRKQDLVGLREGDRVEGSLVSLSATTATVKAGTRRIEAPVKQMAYVAFNTQWQSKPKLKRPYAYVVLDDGTRLTLGNLQWKGGNVPVTGRTLWGAEVQFPITRLVSLLMKQGAATYLADLEPTTQSEGYVGITWPLGRNAMPQGGPLVLKGDTIDFGLGAHARTSATYKLDGGYQTFEALVGMPAGGDPRARIRFRVFRDGKPADGVPDREWSPSDAPMWIRIDVHGVRELTLVADFGSFGDVEARGIWGHARLLRE